MYPIVRVDFHLHSDLSDGYFSPAILAERAAGAGVHFASLTDHHTLDGIEIFREVFSRRGGVAISGVELSVTYKEKDLHLLAYGFDYQSPSVKALIKNSPLFNDVIKTIHEAGGVVFLAHPLHTWKDRKELEKVLPEMKKSGLDGIECFYGPYSEEERAYLLNLAEKEGFLASAGSDFHGPGIACATEIGVDISSLHWKNFRNGLPAFQNSENNGQKEKNYITPSSRKNSLNWRWFFLHILLPVILALTIFVSLIFGIIIPEFKQDLLARKREMIKELTNSAWSVLSEYEKEVREGKMTMEEGQQNAIERIKYMRYGKEGKDYFWITDMHPHMIMHPYREDLNGTDLSDFKDPDGVKLFVEFVKIVKQKKQGYVDYVWQWKDNPERLVPKESYVRGFEPWGWIIGTGIYIEDENKEIEAITRQFIELSVAITLILGLLLLYIARQSFRIERRRSQAERDLKESHEKYRTLVEVSTEGTLMVLGHRCTYANKSMLKMLGYSEGELPLLDVHDIFTPGGEKLNPSVDYLNSVLEGKEKTKNFEATIKRKNKTFLDVLLTPTRIEIAGKKGCILVVKDISGHKKIVAQLGDSVEKYKALSHNINIGVFRATTDAKWPLSEANPAARTILGLDGDEPHSTKYLSEIFAQADEKKRFFKTLKSEGTIKGAYLQLKRSDGEISTVAISAVLVLGDDGKPRFCDGTIEDVTEKRKAETEREHLISQLQTSLLFMNEPITNNMHPIVTCPLNMSVKEAAKLMSKENYTALCVTAEDENVLGIVCDNDFRARVVSEGFDTSKSVYEIMTSPVISILNNALVYEAILLMLEKNVRHLVVRDLQGKPAGIVRNTELLRFHNYSPAVLMQEIQGASNVEEIKKARERLPGILRALIDTGAQPRNLTHIISNVADTVAEKIISLAIQEIGPPPVSFAFAAFGSEGREEQTLVTDQDNAIIYEDGFEDKEDYFKKLADKVCNDLNTAGYKFCKGESMARNPKWCQPLSQWKKYFKEWIKEPNSQELLQFNILFDFRCIFGEENLINNLRHHIYKTLKNEPPFFFHLARNTLQYKVPIGIFGQILTDGSKGIKTLNIKEALLPIVNFARLYALQNQIENTNTAGRLQRLFKEGILRKDSYQELLQAYDFLMLLRYKHQAGLISENKEPNNFIILKNLTHIELTTLKQAFTHIAMVRNRIKYDFPGAE